MSNQQSKKIHGMIDVSAKPVTRRVARATARIVLGEKAFRALRQGGSPKGDVFETAKIAGIMAAKSTPAIIPMCHPLEINQVKVTFAADTKGVAVDVAAEVVCRGRTGVEMEALMAATAAALTIYDMMKWADHAMVVSDVRLIYKSGGKSGTFERRG
ncbi:MAG: cyclic pyranopterin monophosphate synthase MoaC [Candidatus Omnitrophica bacterium]|nr:cyclic pyranopterin monophosphate synthase MoaC [Candidatus Omnitrophota bacterium]